MDDMPTAPPPSDPKACERHAPKDRRAVIHVGPPKTGTTHTQDWIVHNVDRLRAKGWAWPAPLPARMNRTYQRGSSALWGHTKDAIGLPLSLCGTVWKEVKGPRGPHLKPFVRDTNGAKVVQQRWQEHFAHAAKAARNLLVSSEMFSLMALNNTSCEGPKPWLLLRRMLQAAGFNSFTVVTMVRTPLVSWLRSSYNQLASQGKALKKFSQYATANYLSRSLSSYFHKAFAFARAAGFDVQVVDLAGTAEAGLDETDVLACEVLGIKCSGGRWPYPALPNLRGNVRGSTLDNLPIVPLAWELYKQQHSECGNTSLPPLHGPHSDASLAKAIDESAREDCTDFQDLEAYGQQYLSTLLDNACVLHRSARVASGVNATYCQVDPAMAAATPKVQQAFSELCKR